MPHAVGMKPLLLQGRRSIACNLQASEEDVTDSKAGQGLTAMIDEDVYFRTRDQIFRCLQKDRKTAAVCGHSGQYRSFFPLPNNRTWNGLISWRSRTRRSAIS